MASATEVETEREMSIPVQAVVCKATQCAPLRYSAQQRIRSLCRKSFTRSKAFDNRALEFGQAAFGALSAWIMPS